jgi:glycosyltransferase involved in cell wall biosynthesis
VRLAVFTNQFPAQMNTFFARDVGSLIAAGFEVDVYPFYPLDESLWRYVPASLSEEVLPRARVHHLHPADLAGGLRAPRKLGSFLRDTWRLARASAPHGPTVLGKSLYVGAYAWLWAGGLDGRRYDHVLSYWGNFSASCAWLFHRLTDPRVPFTMFIHGRMDLYRDPAFLGAKMLYADNIFLVCEFNRRYISEHYPDIYPRIADKIRIHNLGLDLEQVPFSPGGRPPATILAVGRFEPLKGYRELLRAVALLHQRGLPARLEFVGGGEQEGELRRLAADLGLTEHVGFLGWLPPDGVLEAMRRATVFAHAPVSLDAMPTVVKESIAVGTPVVGADIAGIPEMLDGGRCGVLVPPGDIPALADALARVLGDPALRAELARAGRAHAEELYDLKRNSARLAALLRESGRGEPPGAR